jgi:hypothetical protein
MYGPDLPDPTAHECGARDKACLEEHDYRALASALMFSDPTLCDEAVYPLVCLDAYHMVIGDVTLNYDAVADDPCAWVLLVDGGRAKLLSPKWGIRWVADRGWKPQTFVGVCKPRTTSELPIPMPTWEPPRQARLAEKVPL